LTTAIAFTELPLPLAVRGKVREVYDLGDAYLMVASDRVSAFDVVLPQPIPRKGEVLTLLSAWWFRRTRALVPNHLLSVDPEEISDRYPRLRDSRELWQRRSMLVRRLTPLPVECVVRGYLAGSAWAEYASRGTLAGESLPAGLEQGGPLPEPLFSPATKAAEGHDENISFARLENEVGGDVAAELRDISLALYEEGRRVAQSRGIIVADTKFEFGRDEEGTLHLMDEVLTPDSSRFWPAASYAPGGTQESLDKQPIRDHLERLVEAGTWNREPPAPALPPEVVRACTDRYLRVFERLTGTPLDEVDLAAWSGA
jgi:phosphoribosylaminoimidazole-succinocarboxamide synthase